MTLKGVDLLNLAPIRKADVLDAEVAVGVVLVGGNLTPCRTLSAYVAVGWNRHRLLFQTASRRHHASESEKGKTYSGWRCMRCRWSVEWMQLCARAPRRHRP